jgi:membrane-bound lytic murein transglycosylase D
LNPSYLLSIIPYTGKHQVLTLPKEKISVFVNNEQTLYNYRPSESILDSLKMIKNAISLEKKVHVVKRGESLSSIARKYRVTLNELKRWNNLKKNVVPVGTRLIVNSAYKTQEKPAPPAPKETTADPNSKENTNNTTTEVKPAEPKEFTKYKVRPGDSVWKIAVSHGMTTQELSKLNNIKGNKVNVGQVLKVKSK